MLKIRILLLCCFCLNILHAINSNPILFSKAERVNEHTVRIPFKLVDHLIIVEAEVLNQKGNFIIDTGSETLILNKIHFPSTYNKKKSTETSGIIQQIDRPVERHLKSMYIEGFSLKHKKSDVINLSHIETSKNLKLLGIIGYNILKDYEVFVDLYLNQITLTKTDKNGEPLNNKVYAEKITDSINFKLKNHTIVLNCTINKQKLKFGLDTAAEFNQISKRTSAKALKYFIPKKQLNLVGIGNKKIKVLAGKLHRVKLSETIYFGPMLTVLTNLKQINKAFGTQLDGVLGYEFFAQKRTIINYKKEKLYFIDFPIIKQ